MNNTHNKMYTVLVNSYEIREKKVYYCITVSSIGVIKETYKRYSDLKELDQLWNKTANDFKLQLKLPIFPGRSYFKRTNESVEAILARSKELQQYLQETLNIEKIHPFPSVKEFLPPSLDDSILIPQLRTEGEYSKDVCWNQMDELKRSFLEKEDRKFKKGKNINKITNKEQRYTFFFEDYTFQNDAVVYTIYLYDSKRLTKHKFLARYSDLREYYVMMKKKKFNNPIPPFPKRKLIGQTKENPLEIQERQDQLSSFLNSIFKIPEFTQSEILIFFISKIRMEGINFTERKSRNKQPNRTSDPPMMECLCESGNIFPERDLIAPRNQSV